MEQTTPIAMESITIKVCNNWNDHTERVYKYDGWANPVAEIYALQNGFLVLVNSASTGFRRQWFQHSGRAVIWAESVIKQLFPFKKVEFIDY